MDDPYFWFAMVCFAISGVAALGARALFDFSRTELQKLAQLGNKPERFGAVSHHDVATADGLRTWQMLGLACGVLLAAFAVLRENWAIGEFAPLSHWPAWIGLLFAVVTVEIWLPQIVARAWSAPLVYYLWPLWRIAANLALPVTAVTYLVRGLIQRLSGRPVVQPTEETIEEEIRTIVSEGEREGLLEEEAREMIEGVFELSDAHVSRIMTPRTEMILLPLDSTWDDVIKFVAEAGHTRLPVYGKSRDEITGVLHIKDLLSELAKPAAARRPFRNLLRKPYFVPETKKVQDLLHDFQRSRIHLAVVLDEYGGVSGLVTIEDVLEEIVGDIADEHDEHPPDELQPAGEGRWEALARSQIRDVNERLNLDLPEEADFDTLGGFVFHELGRIPHVGEELTWRRIKIRVLDATRRRIDRLLLEILPEPAAEETGKAEAEKAME